MKLYSWYNNQSEFFQNENKVKAETKAIESGITYINKSEKPMFKKKYKPLNFEAFNELK
jgi:hypothetical protein